MLERYRRAERLLNFNLRDLAYNVHIEPHWLPDGKQFWYKSENPEGTAFWIVDPCDGGRKTPAFDHGEMAQMLSRATGREFSKSRLPISDLTFHGDGTLATIASGATWSVDFDSSALVKKHAPYPAHYAVSPNERCALYREDDDLYLRDYRTHVISRLTTDGARNCEYAIPPTMQLYQVTIQATNAKMPTSVVWSPDGRFAATYRRRTHGVSTAHLLQTSPPHGERPRNFTYTLALPGDRCLPLIDYMLVDLQSKTVVHVDTTLDNALDPKDIKTIWWGPDNRLYYVLMDRSLRALSVRAFEPQNGTNELILEEQAPHPLQQLLPVDYHPPALGIAETQELVWCSNRDGWSHLYLYANGALVRRLTSGTWNVVDVVSIDPKNRWVYFVACGQESGRNPYFRHFYRASLDGSEPMLLTPEDADHSISLAPSSAFFVDTYSKIDQAPITTVRDSFGNQIALLEKADLSRAFAAGWTFPEPFVVRTADGTSDVYGIMIKPSDFERSRKYPVLDAIYAGPQTNRVPASFVWPDMEGAAPHNEHPLAELGFIVVLIDGRGTPNRSPEFHQSVLGETYGDSAYLNDHVAAIQQLAARHDFIDIERVGIYGQSNGGYTSARAMLRYPDFFKVAVSGSGNHDQRQYLWTWGEAYVGDAETNAWRSQDNSALADRLIGKLFLMIPELDDNVPPALTYRFINALIKANKDFDLLVVPNTNHTWRDVTKPLDSPLGILAPSPHPYVIRRRWDYFVRYLLHETPPEGYAITLDRPHHSAFMPSSSHMLLR